MLSIELIRRDPDGVRSALASRGEPDQITGLLELDAQWRGDKTKADEIRNQRNQVNRDIGHARSAGEAPSPDVIEQMRALGGQVDELDRNVQQLEGQIHEILLYSNNKYNRISWICKGFPEKSRVRDKKCYNFALRGSSASNRYMDRRQTNHIRC